MIREGSIAWVDDATGNVAFGPFRVLALVATGLLFSALAHWFHRSRKMPEQDEAPVVATINQLPFPVWIEDVSGHATGNTAFSGFPENLCGTAAGNRIGVEIGGTHRWFSTGQFCSAGSAVKFALPCDELVETEASLARLMETLSTTFAHLPIGLAVFDADRTLNLFNPALGDLLSLDPAWLAGKPTLFAFLEKLRGNRHLPEHGNFRVWRHRLTGMTAADSTGYREDWQLSGELVLRVTGQAHPEGATAFLFEDISAEVRIERLLHSETAVNQAVLDHIDEAILLLSGAGTVIFSNAAFDRLFNRPCEGVLKPVGLDQLQTLLGSGAGTGQLLDKIRTFISFPGDSDSWSTILDTPNPVRARLFRTPDSSLCISFSSPGSREQTDSLLALADTMLTTINESTSMSDPLNIEGLVTFLRKRGITLDLTTFPPRATDISAQVKTRRILWYLVLAASNMCRDGGRISLASNIGTQGVTLSCTVDEKDTLAGQNSHLSLGLLRQLVEQAGGGVDWVFDSNARPLTVSCVLPAYQLKTIAPMRAGNA